MSEKRPSINWPTASFLVLSPIVALTMVPWYVSTYGIGLFEILHFVVM